MLHFYAYSSKLFVSEDTCDNTRWIFTALQWWLGCIMLYVCGIYGSYLCTRGYIRYFDRYIYIYIKEKICNLESVCLISLHRDLTVCASATTRHIHIYKRNHFPYSSTQEFDHLHFMACGLITLMNKDSHILNCYVIFLNKYVPLYQQRSLQMNSLFCFLLTRS